MNIGSIDWYKVKTTELHREIRAMRELTPRGQMLNLQDDLVEKITRTLYEALHRNLWSSEDVRPKTYSGIYIPMEKMPEYINMIMSNEIKIIGNEIKYTMVE